VRSTSIARGLTEAWLNDEFNGRQVIGGNRRFKPVALQLLWLPLHGSLDALDQLVYFKWLPEQAGRTRGRGSSL
jgi:hypothetical protein